MSSTSSHCDTSSHATNSTAPMFSMEQVTALIQQMKEEQALLLQNQREIIVKQVLEQLHSSTQQQKQQQQQHSQPPAARLEKNLHQLVIHSLEESGLDFPHVHTKHYAPFPSHHHPHPLTNNLSSTRPKSTAIIDIQESGAETSSPQKKNLILMRQEPVEMTIDARRVDELHPHTIAEINNETEAMTSFLNTSASHQMLSSQSKQKAHCKMFDASPLRTTKRKNTPQKIREKVNSRRRAMRRFSPGKEEEEEVVEELENDTISMSFRRSIDHKTMAILEKSKALLQETKRQGNISIDPNKKKWQLALKDSSVSEETSTHDQQQDKEPSPPSKSQSQHQQAKEKEAPNSIQKEKMKKKKESKDHSYVPAPNATLVHEAPQSPVPTQSSPKKILEQVHQEMEQVELLQAPEHPPENENEWENELARQILTIYATSVKAKVALQAQAQTQIQEPGTTNGGGPTTMLPSLRLTPAKSSTSRSSSSSNSRFAGSTTLPSTNLPPGSHASVHYSWEPSHLRDDGKVIINLPKIPKPVWFAGTGAVKAVWCALAQGFQDLHESEETETIQTRTRSTTVGAAAAGAICEHHFCEQVRQMEAELKYNKCITTLETLLLALVRARGLEVGELEKKLWKQLVVTCNAFASRAIDYKKFPLALELLKQAERLIQNSILVAENSQMRMELMAFVYDTYAHYYYRRHKPNAAFQYLKKAQDIHTRQSSWSHIAKCRLHLANVLNFQGKHFQSLEMLASILQLIEDNRLEESIGNTNTKIVASAQKICLASVCYNNLAIEQLHLKAFENAHTSCGNAKRLAKLCLSYSNRWLHQFEATGNCVALAITTLMEDANKVITTTTTTTTKWSSTNFDEKARIAAVTKDVTNNDF